MSQEGTWGSDVEIITLSNILDVDVYVANNFYGNKGNLHGKFAGACSEVLRRQRPRNFTKLQMNQCMYKSKENTISLC